MIALVSSSPRELAALAALCASRAWPTAECASARAFARLAQETSPRVVIVRHKLSDGYADDIISATRAKSAGEAKLLVLIGAGTSSTQEARLIALGADCVQRDPVRADVLVEYIAHFLRHPRPMRGGNAPGAVRSFPFAGATVFPLDRRAAAGRRSVRLTPREVQLAEQLFEARNGVVTYTALYHEILARRYDGDTGNMRVLLGKLDASFQRLGISLRPFIQVIAKTGYRYMEPRAHDSPPVSPPRRRAATRKRAL